VICEELFHSRHALASNRRMRVADWHRPSGAPQSGAPRKDGGIHTACMISLTFGQASRPRSVIKAR
jgi:hypothetical protein